MEYTPPPPIQIRRYSPYLNGGEAKEFLWTFVDIVTVTEGMHKISSYAAVTPEQQKELIYH